MNINFLLQPVADAVLVIREAGLQMANTAVSSIGHPLFSYIATIAIVVTAFRIIMSIEVQRTGVIKETLILLFSIGGIFWMLDEYRFLTGEIVRGFGDAATLLVGGDDAGDASILNAGLTVMNNIIGNVIDLFPKIWEKHSFGMFSGSTMAETFQNILFSLVVMVVLIVTLIAMFYYIAVFMLSQVLLVVALAIGPIFIPWVMFPATRFLFMGWLKFLLSSALFHLIGPVMISLIGKLAETILAGRSDEMMTSSGGISWWAIIPLITFTLVLIPLIKEIPKIATAIIGGGGGIGVPRSQ